LRGRIVLHWFAAHPSIAAAGSALDDVDPVAIARDLAHGVDVPAGWVAIPAHPWQAREVARRRGFAELLDAGLLRELGPGSQEWHPTSSVRTVFRAGAPVMLKLSLGLRITNSRRENLRSELLLGVRAYQLLDALEHDLRAAHPGFRVLRDPAWLAVEPAGGGTQSGLEVILRENPFDATDPVVCLAGLLAERPGSGSRLGAILRAASQATGTATGDLAAHWVGRFVDTVVAPVLWLLQTSGLGLEAHAQNVLVALDADGFPVGGWYRDNQGFYVAATHAEHARAAVPDLEDGVRVVFDDALVQDRVAYYLVVNALLGLIGALGAEGVADELDLLRAARRRIEPLAARSGGDDLAQRLLDASTLPCKANLLTCADGRDELDGPAETQSVYVDIANPLAQP
jgi:siderophore synthetase component